MRIAYLTKKSPSHYIFNQSINGLLAPLKQNAIHYTTRGKLIVSAAELC